MSINKVILVGRISNDITVNKSQSGTSMCNFSLAVDRYMGKDKEKATDFIRCTAFGATAETLGRYAGKGKQIAIEGNIKTGSYKDKNHDDVTHYTQDVQVDKVELLGSKSDTNTTPPTQAAPAPTAQPEAPAAADNSGDEVPF